MSTATIPNIFVANTIIQSASMNANFTYLVNILNTNLLPPVGTANSLVTTDSSGNLQASAMSGVQPLTTKGDLYTFTTVPARLPVGTDNTILISDSTQTTGLRWGTPTSSATGSQLANLGLSVAAVSNALTATLTQADGVTAPSNVSPASIGMRSPTATSGGFNQRLITSTLSQTLSAETSLGMLAAQNNNLWLYAIDSDGAGTIKLGLSTVRHDDGSLINVVAESAAVTISIATPGVVTDTAHNRLLNDRVRLTTTGALPTGLAVNTDYYLISVTTNTYELATIPGGPAINTSGTQSGIHTIHTCGTPLVSGVNYNLVAIRLIGRAVINITTVGLWVNPIKVELAGQFEDREGILSKWYLSADNNFITNEPFTADIIVYDTHNIWYIQNGGGVSADFDGFLIPKSGMYELTVGGFITTTNVNLRVTQNGTALPEGVVHDFSLVPAHSSVMIKCSRNDLISTKWQGGDTLKTGASISLVYLGPIV